MSRTYRERLDYRTYAHGRNWTWEEEREYLDGIEAAGEPWVFHRLGWGGHYYVDRRARDRKPWDKPDKAFKRAKRQVERARVRNAMATGREPPIFRRGDQWDWT